MTKIRMKLLACVIGTIAGILASSWAVAASANWINPNKEVPAYVTLAHQDIQDNKTKGERNVPANTRVSD